MTDYQLTEEEKNEALLDELLKASEETNKRVIIMVRKIVEKKNKIQAIRLLRNHFHTGLKETYDLVNKYLL